MMMSVEEAAESVVELASEKQLRIATAESCTGGMIAGAITSIAGSSDVMDGSVVSYSNRIKHQILDVPPEILDSYGAVSEQTACAMAEGVRERLGVDCAVSVTGIAGPGGGTPEKPVGTVWIGVADAQGSRAQLHQFDGNRAEVREKTVIVALQLLCQAIEEA